MTPDESDAHHFEAIYRAHYAAIAAFAHRRVDAGTAEEVIARTFAIAWRRLDEIPARPLPWLAIVARNVVRSERRAAADARLRERTERLHAIGQGQHAAPALAPEGDEVRRAFSALPTVEQEALRLMAWDGFGSADAAAVAGATRMVFAMRAGRARRRFGRSLRRLEASVGAPATTLPSMPPGRVAMHLPSSPPGRAPDQRPSLPLTQEAAQRPAVPAGQRT